MITRQQAIALPYRFELHHVRLKNADGTPVRCRINGKCKVWKRRPDDWELPVKYGLKQCFYLNPYNADEWVIPDATVALAIELGLDPHTPTGIIADKLDDMGRVEEATKLRPKLNQTVA